MALHFEIKQKQNEQTITSVEQLVSDNMAYGFYEDIYCLIEGETGNPTVVFDTEHIGRGVEVEIDEEHIFLDISVPATEADVELAFTLLDKALSLCGTTTFVFEEEDFTKEETEQLKSKIKAFQQKYLPMIGEQLAEGPNKEVVIYGAIHPIAFGPDELKQIGENDWQKYGDFLHQLQDLDVYIAKPILMPTPDGIVGIYVLTDSIASSFPLNPDYLVQHEVSRWLVGFFDRETNDDVGMISYENFLKNTDTGHKLDAARFMVKKDLEEMKRLLEKYGEEL